ncbi:MAG TPA: sugar kinase [Hyphomicrobiaceae bacterium]|nr:sugar kinase [Hyphomicrobiaceae bacterium]
MRAGTTAHVASIGECMIELSKTGEGLLSESFGGDSLNTAVYLARLGVRVDYVTALGDDPWSEAMLRRWQAEGIGTGRVVRVPGRLPGLYVIDIGDNGERRFFYWRQNSAARLLFELPETSDIAEALPRYDLIYLTGVSLSLYGATGRARLFDVLDRARAQGRRVAFDTNFRPRGWPEVEVARQAYRQALQRSDMVLASSEDLELLFGNDGVGELPVGNAGVEVVVKFPNPTVRIHHAGTECMVPTEPAHDVVDTTAAGDSFAASYIAARLAGADVVEAATLGHRLAGAVVRCRGAIIPRAAMPPDLMRRQVEGSGDANCQ